MNKPLQLLAAALSFSVLPACGLAGLGANDVALPPTEALFVPKPSDEPSDTQTQALCADGNDAITDLEARIDALNASVGDDLALLRALRDASPSTDAAGITTYEATVDGRTLHVQLVQTAGQVAITGDINDTEVIAGSYADNGQQGALTLHGDVDIQSAWSQEGEGLQFARTQGSQQAAVSIDDADVKLALTDGPQSLAATWDRETRAGQFAVNDGGAACWGAGTSIADLCDANCEP